MQNVFVFHRKVGLELGAILLYFNTTCPNFTFVGHVISVGSCTNEPLLPCLFYSIGDSLNPHDHGDMSKVTWMKWESWSLNSELLDCQSIVYNGVTCTCSRSSPIYEFRAWCFLLCAHSRSPLTILKTPLLLPKDGLCPFTISSSKISFYQVSSPYRSLDHSWRSSAKEVSYECLVYGPLNF